MLSTLLPAVLLFSQPAVAEEYQADVAHSTLVFVVESALIDAQGTFNQWSAVAIVDGQDLSTLEIRATIDIGSIDTGIEKRDSHLTSPDFFESSQHAKATFKSRSVKVQSPESVLVTGDLTIKGITKTVTIPVSVKYQDETRYRLAGSFTIDRMAFGVDYQSNLNPISNDVTINLDVNFTMPRQ
jgi:polyisoprenoid-binding protein YceI